MTTLALAISTVSLGGVAAKLWHDRRDARRTVNLLRNVEHMLRAEAKAEAVVAEQNEKLLTNAENAAKKAWAKAAEIQVEKEMERQRADRLAAQLKKLKARSK